MLCSLRYLLWVKSLITFINILLSPIVFMENGKTSPRNHQHNQSGPNYARHPHIYEGVSKGETETVQE